MTSAVHDAIRLGVHMDPTRWVSHVSGRVTPIEDMADEHLLAAINMIDVGRDANGTSVPDWCRNKAQTLITEALKRGIHGQYSYKNRIRDGWDA